MAYNGNKNLVSARDEVVWTQDQVREFIKCSRDATYFIEKYIKIVNVDRGLIPFELYDYQRDIVNTAIDNRFVICKLPRQSGKTTTVAGLILWYALFNENYSIAILANKRAQALDIVGRIQLGYEHLPQWLKQPINEWNKGSVEFANGSRIIASATSSSAIRGTSQNCIAGNSIITLRVDGHIFELPISCLDANSSKYNYNDLGISHNVHQQQIYELVQQYCIDTDSRRCGGSAPYNSEEYGRDGRLKQSRQIINTGTLVSTSSINQDDSRTGFESDEILVCKDVAWETRSNVTDESCGKETILDWLEPHGSNQTENKKSKHGTHYVSGNKTQAVAIQEGQTTSSYIGMEHGYISIADWEEENKRTLRQDKQESGEDQEDRRKASRNEKIVGIETEDERSCQGADSLEQRIKKVEVLTTKGVKQFTGLRVIPNKQTVDILLLNGYSITCTGDHKIETTVGWVCAGDLTIDHNVITNNDSSRVLSVSGSGTNTVYDILNVEDTHSFIANGISVSNCIYLDEFAFIPSNMQEEFFSSVYPTISSGNTSKVLITSTPNGLNMFYKLWVDSEEKRNDYKRIEVTWNQVPGRDEKWKEETIRNTSAEQFRVEFECEFVGSSNTLIDGSKLRTIPYRDPIKKSDDFKVYAEPDAQRLYLTVVDTARGTGNDYSAFIVFDISEMPYRVVATYRNNKVSTLMYPSYVHHFAKLYNNSLVLIETNDIGKQIADILHQDLEYENVIYTALDGVTGQIITGGFSGHSRIGVKTTRVVKKLGCSNLKTIVESDKLIVNDFDLLNEMYRFASKGDSYEAEGGNDDLMMCCVLMAWAMIQPYMRELTSLDLRQSVMKMQERSVEEELSPFGIIDDGRNESEMERMVANTDDNWLQLDALGFGSQRSRPMMAVSDDSWLDQD